MFVRRKANKSGSYSVQVVEKRYGRYVVVRSFGASKDEDALKRMEHSASEFIASYNGQGVLDFQNSGAVTSAAIFSSIASIVQDGPYRILNRVYDGIGFGALGDETLRQLVVSRVCQPMSKLATVDYLRRYCGHDVNINKLYRYMDKLDESMRDKVQQVSVEHTTRILGGRIKKACFQVLDWVMSLDKVEERLNETVVNTDERIIVSYSAKRAAKDAHNRDKGIQRLRKAYSSGKVTKQNINRRGYNKFLVIENDVAVNIDQDKIAEDTRWDGLKSYVTNTSLPAAEVIRQYHGLWVVERAFRISKGTLETRPIFHFTERRIEAHICICFMAYKVYKELERILGILNINLSVDKVMDIAKTISTVTIHTPDGRTECQVMLLTDEQRLLEPLISGQN